MKRLFGCICLVFILCAVPQTPSAGYGSSYYNQQPTRVLRAPMPLRIVRRPVIKKQTLLQKIWSVVGPGILGSAGVLAGSAVAWYTLRKKTKTFTTYYQQISEAQRVYQSELTSGSTSKAQAKATYKKTLTLIQEEAELTAAQKKLDQEQLTAIVNKINRMLNES